MVDQLELDAIFTVDPTGNILSWNDSTQRVFGYTEEEIKDENISSFKYSNNYAYEVNDILFFLAKAKKQDRFKTRVAWAPRRSGVFWSETRFTELYRGNEDFYGFAIHVRRHENPVAITHQLQNIAANNKGAYRENIDSVREIVKSLIAANDDGEREKLLVKLQSSSNRLDKVLSNLEDQLRGLFGPDN